MAYDSLISRFSVFLFTLASAAGWSGSLPEGVELHRYRLATPNHVHVLSVSRSTGLDLILGFPEKRRNWENRQRTSEIADLYNQLPDMEVIAAVNCSHFNAENNWLPGPLASDSNLIRFPTAQIDSLALADEGEYRVNQTLSLTEAVVNFPEGRSLPIDQLNDDRRADSLVLYTPHWGGETGTVFQGTEIIVENLDSPLCAGKKIRGNVTAIRSATDSVSNAIPPDGLVLSARSGHQIGRMVHPGDEVSFYFEFSDPTFHRAQLLIGAKGWLLDGGDVDSGRWAYLPEQFTDQRHPRTILAWNASRVFLVVIDGRSEMSVGMTLSEAAEFLKGTLGAQGAVNLDGGGSTTLVVGGEVLNDPSDLTGERPVGNALLLVRRNSGQDDLESAP